VTPAAAIIGTHASPAGFWSPTQWSSSEKAAERVGDGGGSFFGEEVPAVDWFAGYVGG